MTHYLKFDWFLSAYRENLRRERRMLKRPGRKAWFLREKGRESDEARQQMLAFARTLARVQGAPNETRISFTDIDGPGAAAAGFEDAPKDFTRPFILLAPDLLNSCDVDTGFDVVGSRSSSRYSAWIARISSRLRKRCASRERRSRS